MKKDVDRAIAFGTVAAVAIIPTVMMVGVSASGGFNGGSRGGPIIPAAGQAPPPAPEPSTSSPSPSVEPKGPAAAAGMKPGAGSPGGPGNPTTPQDTGGARSFVRITNRSISWLNGSSESATETAKITMRPFSFDATTVDVQTGAGHARPFTSTTRLTVIGKVETTYSAGIRTGQRTLTDPEYADFVRSSDPKELVRYARSFPLLKRQKGLQVLGMKKPPGPMGFETDELDYNLRALLPVLPKKLADQLAASPIQYEGLTGLLVADKYERPWAFGVSRIALPLGMGTLGVLFGGYQK